jgi:hypothetical protein
MAVDELRSRWVTADTLDVTLEQRCPTGRTMVRDRSKATTPAGGIVFRGAAGKAITARSKLAILRPPAVVAGDVEVASILVLGAAVVTPPPGWSVVRTDVNGSVWRQIVYVHVAGSAEPASYIWKLSVTSKAAGTLAAYGGVDPASPIVASSGQVNASSTSIVAPGVTNPASGRLLVGFFGIVTDPVNSVTPPGGMTERVEVAPASGSRSRRSSSRTSCRSASVTRRVGSRRRRSPERTRVSS